MSTDPSWLVAFGYKADILGSVHPNNGNGIRPDPTDSREVILSVGKYNICIDQFIRSTKSNAFAYFRILIMLK